MRVSPAARGVFYFGYQQRVATCQEASTHHFRDLAVPLLGCVDVLMVVPKAGKLLVSIKRKKNAKTKAVTRREGGADAPSSAAASSKQSQRGIFGAFQRALWRRHKPSKPLITATAETASNLPPLDGSARVVGSPLAAAATRATPRCMSSSVSHPSFSVLKPIGQDGQATAASAAPALHRPVDEEEEYEDDDQEQDDTDNAGDVADAKRRKHSRWVPKLLVLAEKMRDRIHTKKKKTKSHDKPAVPQPPKLFSVVSAVNMELLAQIMAFLPSSEPASHCSRVNRTLTAGVRAYYELYCAHPRPRGFLVHRVLLPLPDASFLPRILAWLPVQDRVRAGGTCRAFLKCCDAMPLEITSEGQARLFLSSIGNDETRVEARFAATGALRLGKVASVA